MSRPALSKAHNEGFKPVAVKCSVYDLLRRVVEHINAQEIKTLQGFTLHVRLKDVAEAAIVDFAAKHKIK